LFWVGAVALLGAALLFAFPGFATATVQTLEHEPWMALGVGFAALVGGPLVAILLCLTVLGMALGLMVFAVYALALVAGFLAGALFLGTLVLRRVRGEPATALGHWIAALGTGLVAVALVCLVPLLGPLVGLTVLLLGLGALALRVHREWRAWRGSGGALAAAA
jgi:hypothetical protein